MPKKKERKAERAEQIKDKEEIDDKAGMFEDILHK